MESPLLIVDGVLDGRLTAGQVLAEAGYPVRHASGVEQLIRLIPDLKPRLVLFGSPPDGEDPAAKVCRMSHGTCIPVVLMVPAGCQAPAVGRVPGLRAVVFTPCRPRTLLEVVQNALFWKRCPHQISPAGCFPRSGPETSRLDSVT